MIADCDLLNAHQRHTSVMSHLFVALN